MRTKISFFILAYLLIVAWFQRGELLSRFNQEQAESEFASSKYVLGEIGKPISDDVVYVHSGIQYTKGVSPTTLNFEHPPFIKYLYGWSVLFLGSASWVTFFFFCICIFSFTYLATKLYTTKIALIIAIGLYMANTLSFGFATKPLLDMPQTALLMLSVVVYTLFLKKPSASKTIAWGVVIGLSFSAKYPIPIVFMLHALLLIFAWLKTRKLLFVLVAVLIACSIYILTYIQFFLVGGTLLEFIKFEYWRLHWFLGKTDSPKGLIIQTILFGRHKAWWYWGDDPSLKVAVYEKYSLIWPVVAVFMGWFVLRLRTFFAHPLFPYALWSILAFSVYCLGASNDFYLVALMPAFTLFGLYPLDRLIAGRNKTA